MKSIGAMINQLGAMVSGTDLSAWEDSFVRSVSRTTGDGEHTKSLSERQVEIIERIYRKHFGYAE